MPTSKLPIDVAPVPDAIIQLAATDARVLCNLRPEQRPEGQRLKPWAFINDAAWMNPRVIDFLLGRVRRTRLLIHFQGYSKKERGTAMVNVRNFFFCDDNYPRLDCTYPEEMGKMFGGGNFWGAFLLAVAEISPHSPEWAFKDPKGTTFCTWVGQRAVEVPAHPTLGDVTVDGFFVDGYGGSVYRRIKPELLPFAGYASQRWSVARNFETGEPSQDFLDSLSILKRPVLIPRG